MAGLFNDFNPQSRLPANQFGFVGNAISRGTLISFHYPSTCAMIPNIIHDPFPMVIVTDVWLQYIRGVNLHYLTFPYIKRILESHGGDTNFSYYHVRPDAYVANAFRMYVRSCIHQPRKLDTEWLKKVLLEARSFSPDEIEKIRANIQKQIQSRLQTKAKDLTAYEQWRKGLTQSQQRQLRTKVGEVHDTLTGGVQQNIINPNEGQEGFPPANYPPMPGEGGRFSTDNT